MAAVWNDTKNIEAVKPRNEGLTAFFGVYLGFREATQGIVMNILRRKLSAEKINEKLIEKGKRPEWKWISKEILTMASEELKIHPERLKKVMTQSDYSMIDEIVASFTEKSYIYNKKVKKAVYEVIRNFAVARG